MPAERTIRMLRAGYQARDSAQWRRHAARLAWVQERLAALSDAQDRLTAAWDRIFGELPDDLDDEELEAMHLPDPPEQAEVDALHAQIDAAMKHDKWPRALYFGGI